ncbi:hypothetical protein ACFL0D_09570 [Thermoproteota archaeon]
MLENKNRNLPRILLGFIVAILLVTYTISLVAFISPSQEKRWDTNVEDIIPTSYQAGEDVSITGYIEEGTQFLENGEYFFFSSPETVTWIITIADPSNMPVHFDKGTIIDAEGDLQIGPITYTLPSNPALGSYKVRVFVITDFLPSGDIRINEINEGSFQVIS